jgi:hypothetical protein
LRVLARFAGPCEGMPGFRGSATGPRGKRCRASGETTGPGGKCYRASGEMLPGFGGNLRSELPANWALLRKQIRPLFEEC